MRALGAEGWAGAAMLVVAVAVALPALIGMADPVIPRWSWALLLVAYLAAVVSAAGYVRGTAARLALLLAVLSSWALVLTVPGMGLLHILVVVTAAVSTAVVALPLSLLLAAANTVVILLATLQLGAGAVEAGITTGFYLLIQLATVLSTLALRREREMRLELARAHVELRAANVLLGESARTAERLRISRELHDLIGHQLTVLTLDLEAARHLDAGRSAQHVERADDVARSLLRDVRATVGELRTPPADLQRTLEEMVGRIPGLDVDIVVDPEARLGEEQRMAFLRLAQEAVTNTIRHAEATRLRIELTQQAGQAVLTVHDDGRGAPSAEPGNGLRGLHERFEGLGGTLEIDGRDGFALTGRVHLT